MNSAMNPKRILLVDDDPDYLIQTKKHLERSGYRVEVADSRKEAELLLSDHSPDLAIFDLMMEEDDSGFVLSYLSKQKYPACPVVILTGVTHETGIRFSNNRASDSDWIKADRFLEKGLQPDQLVSEIEKLLF